jgi:hypothetical protein
MVGVLHCQVKQPCPIVVVEKDIGGGVDGECEPGGIQEQGPDLVVVLLLDDERSRVLLV